MELHEQLANQLQAELREHIEKRAATITSESTRQFYERNKEELHALWAMQFCFDRAVNLMVARENATPAHRATCGYCGHDRPAEGWYCCYCGGC